MNALINEFITFVTKDCNINNKEQLIQQVLIRFQLSKDRTIYYCDYFAVRFSYSKSSAFSNTVLSLSHLKCYDHIPFLVVLVRGDGRVDIYLANSTFLSKISHSSKELSISNIRGSFNGSDIVKDYNGVKNCAQNIDALFAFHVGLTWSDNLLRLVEASSNITPTSVKFQPSESQREVIFNSISRSVDFIKSSNFSVLEQDLKFRVESCKDAILVASHIENVNIRGRLIEALITSDTTTRSALIRNLEVLEQNLPVYDVRNGLGDYVRTFDNGTTYVDIKTKIIYLNSNPKAFNIDKFLECMSLPDTIFLFYFLGVDSDGSLNSILCSVYHNQLMNCTAFQHHWAGRASRGVTQYTGVVINEMLQAKSFANIIIVKDAEAYLKDMLSR